jgi:hypothetical protein
METPPMTDPGTDAPDDTSNGYTIEIKVDGSGAITLSVEPAADEAAEEQGEGAESGQPVKNIKEACSLVMDIFNNAGQMTDGGDGDFDSGFGASKAAPAAGAAPTGGM